jgi:hypothetical protein
VVEFLFQTPNSRKYILPIILHDMHEQHSLMVH